MNEKMDNFTKELRAKLDAVDKRIKDLKTSAKGAADNAKVEAKTQLAALDARAKDHRSKLHSAEVKANAWLEQKKTATSEKIAAWKAQHEVDKLVSHADNAEEYAVASMQLAIGAVDEAERAAVEALVARIDADYAEATPAARA